MSLNHILTENPANTTSDGLNITVKNVNTGTINGQVFPALNNVLYQNPASSQITGDLVTYDLLTNECKDSGINVSLSNINCATKSLQNVTNLNTSGYVQTNQIQSSIPSTGSITFDGSGQTQINWNGSQLLWLRQYNITSNVPFICDNIQNTIINRFIRVRILYVSSSKTIKV